MQDMALVADVWRVNQKRKRCGVFTNLILVYCTLQSSADLWVCIAYSIASDIYLHVTVCTKPLVSCAVYSFSDDWRNCGTIRQTDRLIVMKLVCNEKKNAQLSRRQENITLVDSVNEMLNNYPVCLLNGGTLTLLNKMQATKCNGIMFHWLYCIDLFSCIACQSV